MAPPGAQHSEHGIKVTRRRVRNLTLFKIEESFCQVKPDTELHYLNHTQYPAP